MTVQNIPADLSEFARQELAGSEYSPFFVLGYISSALETAAENHPDDKDLALCLAMYRVWRDHQDERVAEGRQLLERLAADGGASR